MSHLRKVLLGLGALAVLLVVALVVLVLTLDVDQFREPILRELSEALGRPVQASGLGLSFLPLSITLNDVKVAESPGFPGDHFITFRGVRVGVSLSSLLGGDLDAESLMLDGATVYLRENREGLWNFSDLGPPSDESAGVEASGSGSGPRVKDWQIREAALVVERPDTDPLRLEIFEAEITDFSTTNPFSFEMTGQLGEGLPFQAEGSIGPLDRKSPGRTPIDARLSAAVRLENLGETIGLYLPNVPGSSGEFTAEVRLRGTVADPEAQGEALLRSAEVPVEGLDEPARIKEARITIEGELLKAEPFEVEMGEVGLQCSFQIEKYRSSPVLKGRVGGQGVPIAALSALVRGAGLDPLPGGRFAGQFDGDFQFSGRLGRDTPMNVQGKGKITEAGVQPAGWERGLYIKSADLEVLRDQVRIENLQAGFGSGSLRGFLRLENFDKPKVRFQFSGDTLNVDEWLSASGDPAGEPAATRSSGSQKKRSGIVSRVRGSGTLKFTKVIYGATTITPFQSRVTLANGRVLCEPIRFGLYNGGGDGRLEIDLAEAEPSLRFSGKLGRVDINQLLTATSDAKDRVFGVLQASLDLTASGSDRASFFESARASGQIRLLDGMLARFNLGRELAALNRLTGLSLRDEDTPLEEVFSSFTIRDGWARTEDLVIRTPDLTMSAQGGIGLDGRLDLNATAAFTVESSRQMASGGLLGGLLGGLFRDQYGRIVIPFDVRGSLEKPLFELDAARLVQMRFGRSHGPRPQPPRKHQ